jgi:anti-sigma factor RsiW
MSEVFSCDDKETLIAYLYGDVEADVRREVERHLRTCAACTRETEGLQAVRLDLQAWAPPETDLGFTIQRSSPVVTGRVLTSSRWAMLGILPAWTRVAAAALFIGVGLGLANVQVRSTSDGFTVTTGWMRTADSKETPALAAAASLRPASQRVEADAAEPWRVELAALEQSLRREMAAGRVVPASAVPVRTNATADEAAIMRRVQQLIAGSIAQSEERQRQEIAAKLIQAERIWNVRRQTDLYNVQRTLSGLQTRTFAVQANQQDAINQLRRVNYASPNQ